MSISKYNSVVHTTCNAKGNEEIKIVYEKTLWQTIFKKPATDEVYEKFLGSWFCQNTGERLDYNALAWIDRLKAEMRYAGIIGQWD